jgi:hypothetical protein
MLTSNTVLHWVVFTKNHFLGGVIGSANLCAREVFWSTTIPIVIGQGPRHDDTVNTPSKNTPWNHQLAFDHSLRRGNGCFSKKRKINSGLLSARQPRIRTKNRKKKHEEFHYKIEA